MCDFHRSLDRALEPHADLTVNRYFPHDPVVNVAEAGPLPEAWQDLGYISEDGVGHDLLAIQDRINREVAALAAVTMAPALFEPVPEVVVEWGNPARLTHLSREEAAELLSTNSVTIRRHWLSRWICGFDPRPTLAEQEIPAEGTE